MLTLRNICKEYVTGNQKVQALKDVSVSFRKNEFVSILGPSGCGKTTLLNLIGGLDRYTSGDIEISGVSTKKYKDRDWDAYRNHTIGFVFQSYNLIPHQTILSNVELALTLTGVSKAERREKAKQMLIKVGLADHMDKRPAQLSGGQMQRVAIARALINDPEIVLADEPTGALDTETGVQIMEILKEVASDRLVIMVTHNPDLARTYSTRIIRLLDGRIVDDSDPGKPDEPAGETTKPKRVGMSFWTALTLSLNNLMTKKARTILISFAGSIGIIGIALILSMSTGVQNYIDRVEKETLASYPITLVSETMDMTSLMEGMAGDMKVEAEEIREDRIYPGSMMTGMITSMLGEVQINDLGAFKAHIEGDAEFEAMTSGVSYTYSSAMNIWRNTEDGYTQVNPSTTFDTIGQAMNDESMPEYMMQANAMGMSAGMSNYEINVFNELLNNPELLESQFDVLAGRWPESKEEMVLILGKNNTISDYALYTLGFRSQEELKQLFIDAANGNDEPMIRGESYSFEDMMNIDLRLVLPTDLYVKSGTTWSDASSDPEVFAKAMENAVHLKIVGIVRPSDGSIVSSMGGSIGYRADLTEYIINEVNASEIVKQQLADPEVDVFSVMPFDEIAFDIDALDFTGYEDMVNMAKMFMGKDRINEIIRTIVPTLGASTTYIENLNKLGVCDLNKPNAINIYPRSFESKEAIQAYIDAYNADCEREGRNGIAYTDYVGLLLSGVTDIIDAITYVLVAFVAISLIVSSIMIGVITYISVLERTKEIGILRAIGASKRDISRVFNAETVIVGLCAGLMGIGVSLLLIIPINAIIESLSGIAGMAVLPAASAAILVGISVLLTLIAGIIPSRFAAKRDPVVALRSE